MLKSHHYRIIRAITFFQPLHSIHTTTIFDQVELAQGSMLLLVEATMQTNCKKAVLGGPGCLN